MSDYLIGHIRTFVPILVGAFAAWLVTIGFEIDPEWEAQAVIALTGLITAAYYALVRALAQKWPWFGTLLGVNIAPKY